MNGIRAGVLPRGSTSLPAARRGPHSRFTPTRLMPRTLARLAIGSLWDELALYPKPGLVSLHDSGAHGDMDAGVFVRSLFALRPHFERLAAAGAAGAPFADLRAEGIAAERTMMAATGGINTHRGAIFALGLLCAAAANVSAAGVVPKASLIRTTLAARWGRALATGWAVAGAPSHGARVRERYGVSGAAGEASRAFPSVFEIALPALRRARDRGCDSQRARLAAFFALLATVEDTNILHRAGTEGQAFVRDCARRFAVEGGVDTADALARAAAIHREFTGRRLSPGGCADLLAAALFVDVLEVG